MIYSSEGIPGIFTYKVNMLKKLILLVLLCSVKLHAIEQPNNFSCVPKPDHSLRDFVGSLVLIRLFEEAPIIGKYIDEYAATLNEEELEIFIIRLNRALLAAQVAVGIYAVYALYPIFKDIYDYLYPSEAQLAATKAAIEQIKFLTARREFLDCLLGNMRTPRNDTGLPIACENFADVYHAVCGQSALDEMTSRFKACCRV